MITGIGTDLVEIARVQKAIGRSAFLEKIYTEKERELIAVRSVCAASNFAAKEAVAKALGCGFAGIAPAEIEILRKPSGMPYVVLHGRAKERAEAEGVSELRISITNTKEYAQAYAVCESMFLEAGQDTIREDLKETKRTKEKAAIEEIALPVFSATGMKTADRITIEEIGIPSLVLMERAALAVTKCVKKYATKESRIGVLCGTGNNGGDGVAVARILREAGYNACIWIKDAFLYGEESAQGAGSTGTPEFLQQMKMARACGVPICEPVDTKECDIVVDALFGIGLSKPVEGAYAALLSQLNRESHIVIAVDIASGISASDGSVCGVALYANETVTFGGVKCGQLLYPGKYYTGKLTVEDIGFPRSVLWKEKQGIRFTSDIIESILPERPARSNKGTFGKVAVFAGSGNMAGAAYFSACAAYRMGAGLVKIVTPECNREVLQTLLPEALLATYENGEALSGIVNETIQFADTIIVGPGLGRSEIAEKTVSLLQMALKEQNEHAIPSVWDADALNIIATKMQQEGLTSEEERVDFLESWLPKKAVVTPHPGELSRLLGCSTEQITDNFYAVAKRLSNRRELTFVLKDATTLVVKGTDCFFNTTGNNGMATGGSGDILCGVIGALLAAGTDVFTAAALGVWLHGAAGDAAEQNVGAFSMIARDILQAMMSLFEEKEKRK